MDRIAIVFKEGTEKEACFEAAKKELTEKIGDFSPILLVYESDVDNFVYYSDKLHEAYPNTEVIGVTTCSHLSSVGRGGMGLSLIAVNEGIEVATGEILEISKCPIRYSDRIDDIASYNKDTYNRYGWPYVNGLMDDQNAAQFFAGIRDIKNGYNIEKSANGQYIIETSGRNSEVKDTLVYTNGAYINPTIDKVIKQITMNINYPLFLY